MLWHFSAELAGGLVAASAIDWLFAGILFHERYRRYPEVWRSPGRDGRGIVVAQILTLPTVVGLMILLEMLDARTCGPALIVAGLVWAIAAAPAQIVNGVFIKLDPLVVTAHTIGWLVKLMVVAAIVVAAR